MAHVTTSSYVAGQVGNLPGVNEGDVEVYLPSGELAGTASSGAVTITPDGVHVTLHDGRQVFATSSGLCLVDLPVPE